MSTPTLPTADPSSLLRAGITRCKKHRRDLVNAWSDNFDYGSAALRIDAAGNSTFKNGYAITEPKTVGTLTACAAGLKGARSFVTDANATTFLSTVAGGGANNVPVVCDGTNWVIG